MKIQIQRQRLQQLNHPKHHSNGGGQAAVYHQDSKSSYNQLAGAKEEGPDQRKEEVVSPNNSYNKDQGNQRGSQNQATGEAPLGAGQRGNPAHSPEPKETNTKWKKVQIIMHSYYEKPITSNKVIMEKTAHPLKQKITTLSQEVVRRMRNTSRKVVLQERLEILQKFIQKMKQSGYGEKLRREVVKAGLKGYYKMIKREILGNRRVNRDQKVGRRERDIKAVVGSSTWFKGSNRVDTTDQVSSTEPSKQPTNDPNHKKRQNQDQDSDSTQQQYRTKQGRQRNSKRIRRATGNRQTRRGENWEDGTEATLFLPHTPHSKLARAVQH